jgi:predicted acylesterase/phospholipase RssA
MRAVEHSSPASSDAPMTAFVLSGGARLGAMQAGMLRALYEHGIVPDLLVATSAGALNAAFIARGRRPSPPLRSCRASGAGCSARTSSRSMRVR